MTFADLLIGEQVFIDANIFVYYAAADPVYGPSSKQLLERIARQEIRGFTSAHVLGDLAHRVMTLEAISQFGWTAKGIVKQLRQHPTKLQNLNRFRQAVAEVPQMGVQVLPIDFDLVSATTLLSQQFGLLTGDALVVAVMQANGLTKVASADADFDRVAGITRYGPL